VSPMDRCALTLIKAHGLKTARAIVTEQLAALSVVERAALAAYWPFYARPSQIPPETPWRSWGFLCARGFGKTRSIAEFIVAEAYAGRAPEIGVAAQKEADLGVPLEALTKCSPPWFKPELEASRWTLLWPNGARARGFTPEVPGSIRGKEFHMFWATEMQSWPTATMDEAILNINLATRLGSAQLVWDATPKRRHPLLLERLALADSNPDKHIIVRGATHENAANLADGFIADLQRQYGGTSKEKEELLGEMVDGEEAALFSQANIDLHRCEPPKMAHTVIGLDPAVTERAGSDRTGLVLAGLGADERAYVLGDYSSKYSPAGWAAKVIDLYLGERVGLVVVETNKGGDLLSQNLRAAARERGMTVDVIAAKQHIPQHSPRVLFVRETFSRGAKHDRAAPVATAYERGRVSHALGARLSSLEDTLTSWVPSPTSRSPDDLDALCLALTELLALREGAPVANRQDYGALVRMAQSLQNGTHRQHNSISHAISVFSHRGGGRCI
jgi:phage terminase large subunit-like protein